MNAENFAFWLQGYFEVLAAGDDPEAELTPEQVACIKDHLALVFDKRTPIRTGGGERRKKKVKEERDTPTIDFDPFARPDFICKDEKPLEWVTPPANPNQIRLDIEAEIKKSIERANPSKPYRTSCQWTGRGFGQKYC